MGTLSCALHAAIAMCVLGLGAQAQVRSPIARGHEIAKQSCAACHAIERQAIERQAIERQSGASAQGVNALSFKDIAAQRGADKEDLKIYIKIPRHPMPIVHLGSNEIDDVVAYILSLK